VGRKSSRYQTQLFTVEQMTEEAIAFLRQHEPPEGYFLAFSGGKDSIVCKELCRLAEVKFESYYSCTRIDPPEVVKFIREHHPDVTFLYPKMTFWGGIKKKMPPLRLRRWCCDVLKKDPSKHIPLSHRVGGIRAEESHRRAVRPRIDFYTNYKQWMYKPIFYWQEWHIWEFITLHGQPYPSLYDEGFSRIGCVICPYLMRPNQRALNQHKDRWPSMYRVFEKSVRSWYDRKDRKKVGNPLETFEDYMAAYYRGFE
jgi:phosphoadenosine phosphosulfate reductase